MRRKSKKSKRGGKREGAGRPKTIRASSTLGAIDIKSLLAAPPPDEIETVAQQRAHKALASMVKLLSYGTVEVGEDYGRDRGVGSGLWQACRRDRRRCDAAVHGSAVIADGFKRD